MGILIGDTGYLSQALATKVWGAFGMQFLTRTCQNMQPHAPGDRHTCAVKTVPMIEADPLARMSGSLSVSGVSQLVGRRERPNRRS